MKDEEKEKGMTTAYQMMAGETFAMSEKLGGDNALHVLAAVVAYAMLLNRCKNESQCLDMFRKEIEEQINNLRRQMQELLRKIKEEERKAGE